MSPSPRFIDYFRSTHFADKPAEFQLFLDSLERPIQRTIRLNNRYSSQEEIISRLTQDGWILRPTEILTVFALDRREDFDPIDRRIGFSLDHLVGNFYIQEYAAATSVETLCDGKISEEAFLILDMASSPGGKTTQLAERYPESFIIANEPTRERIPQLLQNLDRMGSENIAVTLYPGQWWSRLPETFDRILLDAPCSGEGTAFRGGDVLKHWHLKSIRTIARLQTQLLDSALIALKVGGEMVYSTCTLNQYEDEGVVEAMQEKYPGCLEILSMKKSWPHIDGTGGFFVTKIRKIASLPQKSLKDRVEKTNDELRRFRGNIGDFEVKDGITLYEHERKILAVRNHHLVSNILDRVYCMRFGEKIGQIEGGKFIPDAFAHRALDLGTIGVATLSREENSITPLSRGVINRTPLGGGVGGVSISRYEIQSGEELDRYLRGEILENLFADGYTLLTHRGVEIALERVENGRIRNTFPKDWRRR